MKYSSETGATDLINSYLTALILWRNFYLCSAIKTLSSSKWLGDRWPRWMPVEPQ